MSCALEVDVLPRVSSDQDPGSCDSSLDEVLSFSPDLGLSPVTCLSGNMGHLHCGDSVTPRRKLKLSPDSQQSSPTEAPSLQQTAMGTAALSGMTSLKLASFNVKGFNSPEKRSQVLYHFHRRRAQIVCFQETHFKHGKAPAIRNKYYTSWHFADNPDTKSKGVAIAIHKSLPHQLHLFLYIYCYIVDFPSELTPVLKPHVCNTSDSSFQSSYKPKKAARKVNVRDHENKCRKDPRKKKSRLKLLDLFQSSELVTGHQDQRPEKHHKDVHRESNEIENTQCSESKRVSMGDISPAFNEDESEDLIGDFSKPYSLPIERGNHQDLKYITCGTLAHVLGGGYIEIVQTYHLVDCRYPYEYAGGHIKGALNLYKEDQISEYFFKSPSLPRGRRLVIFHCEFSSERAPKLCRTLRNLDRKANQYPHLCYPELYLLKGGYKEFYETYKQLCEPQGYIKMVHKDFQDQLKNYQKKKKNLSGQRIRKELFKPLTSSKSFSPVTTQSVLKL
ncbi:M-phase inducer phosphatase 1-like [Bufo gargarizans]|uniref:M-phase inducer phosphatase 1-like n=1 Tax=Bufo gargarizans TaxID=30331 RepID=UPI001CF1E6DF|nr:M-phase inducer phosphatase 1-like [Bufo gargarizans]